MSDSSGNTLDRTATRTTAPGAGDVHWPQIEGYDIVDQIGRGGMGVVYEAYQASTGRRVAIKTMLERLALKDEGRRRFEREVSLVARLQHPGIVAVIDSGVHQGRYFYVMEYISGQSLTELIQTRRDPSTAAGAEHVTSVLTLLARLCDAIDYAHQRGVLHRDLKPQNIIVDEHGDPHVLDFGLAKAIDPVSGANPELTLAEPGQVLGTLGYMPPEQARGDRDAAGVTGDVYSLGVIAYELLTGLMPLDTSGTLSDVLHRLNHIDPPAPSLALRRSSTAGRGHSLRGVSQRDVDAVVLRALHKKPSQRYGSAAIMARDVRQLLAGEPVIARHVGPGTRAVRWVGRHRAMSAVVGACGLLLLLGAAWSLHSLVAERNRTRLAAEDAVNASQFLSGLLASANLYGARGPETTIGQLLDEAAEQLRDKQTLSRQSRIMLTQTIANSYASLGKSEKCEQHHREVIALCRADGPTSIRPMLNSMAELIAVLSLRGAVEEAQVLAREADALRAALPDAGPMDRAQSALCAGRVQQAQGDYLAAADSYRVAVEEGRKANQPRGTLEDYLDLQVGALFQAADYEQAAKLCRESLAVYERAGAKPGIARIQTLQLLGMSLQSMGKLADAVKPMEEALQLARRHMRPGGDDLPSILNANGLLLLDLDRLDEAEQLLTEALEMCRANHPGGHPLIASMQNNLVMVYVNQDRLDMALKSAKSAVKAHRRSFGQTHHQTCIALFNLADAHCRLGQVTEGQKACKEALDGLRAGNGEYPVDEAACLGLLARIENDLSNPLEAERLSHAALAIVNTHRASAGSLEFDVLMQLARSLVVRGCHDAALMCAERMLDMTREHWGDDAGRLARAAGWRLYVLGDAGRYAEASVCGEQLVNWDRMLQGPLNSNTLQHQRFWGRAVGLSTDLSDNLSRALVILDPLRYQTEYIEAQKVDNRVELASTLAEVLAHAGCDASAREAALNALAQSPPVPVTVIARSTALCILADIALRHNDAASASQLMGHAMSLMLSVRSPRHPAARRGLSQWGWIELQLGRLAESEAILQTAVNANDVP